MGNSKAKSNNKKILIYFITAIVITVVILIVIVFATQKSALEKCVDAGHIYIWGEQNKADRKSTRLNSSHVRTSRMPSSA